MMKKIIYLILALFVITAGCRKDDKKDLKVPLSVKHIWPNSGKAGTIVTIEGRGFNRDVKVSFSGADATVVDVKDTVMVVLAPEKGTTGTVTVKLENEQAGAGNYTYQDLTMKGVSPGNGPAGTNVSIRGEGFSSLKGPAAVTINGIAATVTSLNDTLLIAAVPANAGSGPVKVTVDGKSVTGPGFIFQQINSIKPLKGGKGTRVVITGEGFPAVAADNTVDVNGTLLSVVSATGTEIVADIKNDVRTGPLSVTINGQKTVGPVFTVIPPPVLQTVAPLSGPAGQEVTISGSNFSGLTDENEILFNGVKATIKTVAEKQLVVTVPAGAGTGNMKVTVNGQTTMGPVFKEQSLGIMKLAPDNGLEGTEVIITGVGFSTNLTDNQVTINGAPVTVKSAAATTLTVTLPAGFTTGTLDVQVGSLKATGPVFRKAGVITLAGGPTTGLFRWPEGITVDSRGNIYVTDNNQLLKFLPDGTQVPFVGNAGGTAGYRDANGTTAMLEGPRSLAIDAQDNIYVVDGGAQRSYVRKVTPAGDVSTVWSISGRIPGGLCVSRSGTLYVSMMYQGVFRVESNGATTRIGNGSQSIPYQMTIDASGVLYFGGGDFYSPYIARVSETGSYSYLAGAVFQEGFADGQGSMARLGSPMGVALDPTTGNIYFHDDMNRAVRMVTPGGEVTTITGAQGTFIPFKGGYKDGTLKEALFQQAQNLCVDKDGNIYLLDGGNKAIRKIVLK